MKGLSCVADFKQKRASELPCESAKYANAYEQADRECITYNKKTTQVGFYHNDGGDIQIYLINRFPTHALNGEINGTMFISYGIITAPLLTLLERTNCNIA